MPKQINFISLCIFIMISCGYINRSDENQYRIVFKEPHWASIDLKSKVLKVDFNSLKFADTLKLTPAQDQEILAAFNKSGLIHTKGSIQYDPDSDPITPAFYYEVDIYTGNKLISNTKVNIDCQVVNHKPLNVKSRAIQFCNIITNILHKNPKFIDAQKRFQKYMSDHDMFFL